MVYRLRQETFHLKRGNYVIFGMTFFPVIDDTPGIQLKMCEIEEDGVLSVATRLEFFVFKYSPQLYLVPPSYSNA